MTDQDQPSTFLDWARADAELLKAGRHAKDVTATVPPIPIYPAQPPNSPFGADPVGPEPTIDNTALGNVFGTALGEPHEQPAPGHHQKEEPADDE